MRLGITNEVQAYLGVKICALQERRTEKADEFEFRLDEARKKKKEKGGSAQQRTGIFPLEWKITSRKERLSGSNEFPA